MLGRSRMASATKVCGIAVKLSKARATASSALQLFTPNAILATMLLAATSAHQTAPADGKTSGFLVTSHTMEEGGACQ